MTQRPGPKLLAETGADLLWSSAKLRVQRFEEVVGQWSRDAADLPMIDDYEARMLARALRAWARRLPWRTQCFEQGLAAMRYLRRRGLAATLHYGARGSGDTLEAHVWVTSGSSEVVGCDNAGDFRELKRFPAS